MLYVLGMYFICIRYAFYMYKVWILYVQGMYFICIRYAFYMYKILTELFSIR